MQACHLKNKVKLARCGGVVTVPRIQESRPPDYLCLGVVTGKGPHHATHPPLTGVEVLRVRSRWAFKEQVCLLRHLLLLPIWSQMKSGMAEIGWNNSPLFPPTCKEDQPPAGCKHLLPCMLREQSIDLLSSTRGVWSLFVPTLGISLKTHHEEEGGFSDVSTVRMHRGKERQGGSCGACWEID